MEIRPAQACGKEAGMTFQYEGRNCPNARLDAYCTYDLDILVVRASGQRFIFVIDCEAVRRISMDELHRLEERYALHPLVDTVAEPASAA